MARVVELGAMCDLGEGAPDGSQSFRVSEYLVLDDGERVVLHDERRFTTTAYSDG